MARIGHGDQYSPVLNGRRAALFSGAVAAAAPAASGFRFLLPALQQDPANRLPEGVSTAQALKELGAAMEDFQPGDPARDGSLPTAYTYLGQFLDHDLTLMRPEAGTPDISADPLIPLANPDEAFSNARTPVLDLDSVYGGLAALDPANPDLMLVGRVDPSSGGRPPGKGDHNDLPRRPRSNDIKLDREALIGDPRNDENTIIAQLHTAFLRAHNALVAGGLTGAAARTALRRKYQSLILTDFLPRIADPAVVQDVISNGPKFFTPASFDDLYMPFEYSAAAYRFGHSLVRTRYDFNLNFANIDFGLLFTFTALSGELGNFDTLPENWIIQWERLLPRPGGGAPQVARRIDTGIAEPLAHLKKVDGKAELPPHDRLATRNLLRGYLIGLPTGQAVAGALGLTPLSGATLKNAVPAKEAAVLASTGFDVRTPLWYYVLAEAGDPAGANGRHLGPVGSRIVAETIVGFIRRSPDSILSGPPEPAFTLSDLITLSGDGA